VIDFHNGTCCPQTLIFRQFLHGKDRADRDIERVADIHDFELGFGHGPGFDHVKYLVQLVEALQRFGVTFHLFPFRLADYITDIAPYCGLGDKIGVSIGICLPAFAFEDTPRLPTAGIIAGPWCRFAEGNAFSVLGILC